MHVDPTLGGSDKSDFPSLCVEYILILLSCKHDFIDLL